MKFLTLVFCIGYLCVSSFLPTKEKIHGFNTIEKNWSLVGDNLFASKFEVTNLEYQVFLKSITNKLGFDISSLQVQYQNWDSLYTDFNLAEHYHQHPSYKHYPVVNISQTSAKEFCKWLTEAYNSKAKRKYTKVQFRLPTEEEWIQAARGGNEYLAPFPWGGFYVRNGNGEFLANFRKVGQNVIKRDRRNGDIEVAVLENKESFSSQGLPAIVTSYYPNGYDLYHMSGNVAEMLSEDGRTKGGSWDSSGYYIRIDAEDEYAGFKKATPYIGFRYFVEVLED